MSSYLYRGELTAKVIAAARFGLPTLDVPHGVLRSRPRAPVPDPTPRPEPRRSGARCCVQPVGSATYLDEPVGTGQGSGHRPLLSTAACGGEFARIEDAVDVVGKRGRRRLGHHRSTEGDPVGRTTSHRAHQRPGGLSDAIPDRLQRPVARAVPELRVVAYGPHHETLVRRFRVTAGQRLLPWNFFFAAGTASPALSAPLRAEPPRARGLVRCARGCRGRGAPRRPTVRRSGRGRRALRPGRR